MEMTNTPNKDNRNRGILVEFTKDELCILEEVAELFDKTYHYGTDLFTIKDVIEHYKKVNHYLSAGDMLIIGKAMYQIQKDISDGFIKSESAIKEETNQAWEQYNKGEVKEDILTYIPDEVETGYIPVEEVEEQHGIKVGKRCRSRNMLPLELNIKNSAEQRAREESRNQDRYR